MATSSYLLLSDLFLIVHKRNVIDSNIDRGKEDKTLQLINSVCKKTTQI